MGQLRTANKRHNRAISARSAAKPPIVAAAPVADADKKRDL